MTPSVLNQAEKTLKRSLTAPVAALHWAKTGLCYAVDKTVNNNGTHPAPISRVPTVLPSPRLKLSPNTGSVHGATLFLTPNPEATLVS